MKTSELIAHLQALDPDGTMEVLATACSDYHAMETSEVWVSKAVEKPTACYVMRSHRSMSDEDKAREKPYIVFAGN